MAAPAEDMPLERRSVRFMAPLNDESGMKDPTASKEKKIFSKSRQTVHLLVVIVKTLMFFLVFITLVASKVSIATMLAHLRSMTNVSSKIHADEAMPVADTKAQHKTAAVLYWQLLFILMIPNIITWCRALFNGVIGKSSSQPRPTSRAILGVSDSYKLHI